MTTNSHSGLSLEQLPFLPSDDVTAVVGGYRLERRVGEGGAGAVFLARDEELDRSVAIKVLHPHNARDVVRRRRFLREGRVMALIDSPYVVRVLQVGEDRGSPFLVMEYLEGEDLGERLKRSGPLPWREALGYVWDASLALLAADAAGVTHRDVKPANLIMNGDHAKLTDFGLATAADDSSSLTMEGLVPGTAAYMAPERMAGRSDRRSDIYSLGATLFVLLTGRTPFEGNDPLAHLSAHLKVTPPRVDTLRSEVPERVADLIGHMLEKDPGDRVQGYDELIDEIDGLLGIDKERVRETGGVRGQLSLMSLTDIVQTLELGSRDALVEVTTRDGDEAVVGVAAGHVVYARVGYRTGVDAFCEIVTEGVGAFVIRYESTSELGRNIDLPTSGLLLEAMRRQDELAAPRVGSSVISADDIAVQMSDGLLSNFIAESEVNHATVELTRHRKPKPGVPAVQAWALLALVLGLGAAVGLAFDDELTGSADTRALASTLTSQLETSKMHTAVVEAEIAQTTGERDRLAVDYAAVMEAHADALAAKAALEAEANRYAGVADGLRRAVPRRYGRVRALPYGAVIELPSRLLFKSASATIGASGNQALTVVALALKDLEGQRFRIEGHTDNVPTGRSSSFATNWELSASRALSVRQLLEEQGIAPGHLSAEARGEHAPISSNTTNRGRARNRRIEIYVVPELGPRRR